MKTACLVLFLSMSLPSGVAAQTAVRLQVQAESWLGRTPFPLEDELQSKLREANIDVVETPDVPLAVFKYHEWQDYVRLREGYGTRIEFGIEVTTPDGSQGMLGENGFVFRSEEPLSTWQLREGSIEILKTQPIFAFAGHVVGVNLGLESSFRVLFSDAGTWGREIALQYVFNRLPCRRTMTSLIRLYCMSGYCGDTAATGSIGTLKSSGS